MKIKIFFILIIIIYLCGYLFFRYEYRTKSSVNTHYINLYQGHNKHVVLHYIFYPALWADFRLTGQEYSFSTEEHPYWIFIK